ncbi:MAG: ethanolamine ammonia-lyase subunit EutB [Methylocystis sp.]|nr:ethanolamine ammonia-lyase subunit EutB [Methylocystis sp.]
MYGTTIRGTRYRFPDLKSLMAKATPLRSGDCLAGIAATSAAERVAAQMALADLPLSVFLNEALVPYEEDEVTRLIFDSHDRKAFAPIAPLTVGEFRDWLLSDAADEDSLAALTFGLTPEMAAAVSKICRNQDLILIAAKRRVVTRFRNTLGLRGETLNIPTQSCVLAHVTTTLQLMARQAPVDLVFQSIGGTQAANASFGIDLALLREAREAALSLKRGTIGDNVMYFETGQGSALSANAHWDCDQQTLEARAYGVARIFDPLLINTVVGFIGPEYLFDGKQITRAALEDHFCGKLLGLPMGCDVCYTNHAEADQNDMDDLLTLLAVAGVNYVMGVPGADDVMLNYQSTSYHDVLAVRRMLNLAPAPEFAQWLTDVGLRDARGELQPQALPASFAPLLERA